MKNAGTTIQINVDSLRTGMFVHLDVGWMSHPFPLSSFRIASDEQIAIIRGLDLTHVRWSPELSALLQADDDARHATERAAALDATAARPVEAGVIESPPAASVEPESPEAQARRQRRAAATAERAALVLCERQFAEATRECRQLTELVPAQPEVAAQKAQSLSQAFVDKMLGNEDLCIRLLTEAAGDRASAHAVNVTLISLLMGRCFGLSTAEMLDLGVGALLHDMGKLDMPARVRHREDHFTPSESKFYEQHVTLGVAHARKMKLSGGATLVVAQHHEHADGSGFPLRIGSDRMTPASRIVSLVNRYDNLCNPHLPSKALTPHEALSLLFAQGKMKHDTAILGAFIKMMGVYPPGSVVQLTDDRYAMVVGVNSSRPLKPRVVVHDPRVPQEEVEMIDLEKTANVGIRRSVRPASLPHDAQRALAPRQRVAYYFEPAAEGLSR